MSARKLFIHCLLLATASLPGVALAEKLQADATHADASASSTSSRLDALREGVREIDGRAKAVRALMEHATPQLRRHSRRVLIAVEQDQMSLVARLEILRTTGGSVDEQTVRSMEATYGDAIKLLARVEGWYTTPKRRL